jgi:hypothetical protein
VELATYQIDRLSGLQGIRGPVGYPKIYLGDREHWSQWSIVGIEASARGGPMVTLRLDGYLGLLPELGSSVPADIRGDLENRLNLVAASSGRADPGSTIDCCRNALALVFGHLCGDRSLDLIPAVDAYVKKEGETEGMRSWPARIVARLHSRGKPNEKEKRRTRAVEDSDAEFAVECVTAVLKELGWTT